MREVQVQRRGAVAVIDHDIIRGRREHGVAAAAVRVFAHHRDLATARRDDGVVRKVEVEGVRGAAVVRERRLFALRHAVDLAAGPRQQVTGRSREPAFFTLLLTGDVDRRRDGRDECHCDGHDGEQRHQQGNASRDNLRQTGVDYVFGMPARPGYAILPLCWAAFGTFST